MASWRTEWQALSARIRGLVDGADLLIKLTSPFNAHDQYAQGVTAVVPAILGVCRSIRSFMERHEPFLPPGARAVLKDFEPKLDRLEEDMKRSGHRIQLVVSLHVFCSEFGFWIGDLEAVHLRQVERAFQHLKRSIVADPDIAAKWQRAFCDPRAEEACERLGAVHLLLHGIWAFKAHAERERTDLVLGTHLTDTSEAESSADAMALTEWKIAKDQTQVDPQVQQAFTQACIYAGGGLAGFELSTVRYLVIVTERRLHMPVERRQGDVLYRIMNIPVRPSTPSASTAP